MRILEQRADFFFWGAVSIMWSAFNFFFAYLLVNNAGSIAGWDQTEMFVLLSVFTMYDAFIWSWFYFNMRRYTENVFNGELDGFLVKPIDLQFFVSVQHNSYNNVFRLAFGVGMLITSVSKLPYSISILEWLLFVCLFILGFILIYSLWFILATCSFWIDRLNNIGDIIPSLRRLNQFPREVYSGIASFLFTGLFPIVLVTSLPAEVLTHRVSLQWVLYFTFLTFFFLFLSRIFFHFSLKRYSGAGS